MPKQRNPWNWGTPYATQERQQPQDDQPEHSGGEEGGQAPEAGGGDSDAPSGKTKAAKPKAKKKVTADEPDGSASKS